ncbi:hypothetical protein D9M69_509440 [compost metagenome]
MLYHDHRIALIHQGVHGLQQLADIVKMKTGGRLIKDKQGLAFFRVPLPQEIRQFYPLGLSPGEGIGGLTQANVSQSHLLERQDLFGQFGLITAEKVHGFIHRHSEDVRNVLIVIGHFQDLLLEPFASAAFAGELYIGHELHLNGLIALALAGFTAAAVYIKREVGRFIVALFRQGLVGHKRPDGVISFDVGNGVRAA